MKLNRMATASVLAGLALTLASCSIIAPKYFEKKKAKEIRYSLCDSIWESSTCAIHFYTDAISSPENVKKLIESAAAGDSSLVSLRNTGDLCFGPFGKRLIGDAIISDSTWARLEDIRVKMAKAFYRNSPIGTYDIDSLHAVKEKTDSMSIEMPKNFRQEMVALFSKLQALRTDFLEEYYALKELQMENNADTLSTPRLVNAVYAFYYSMNKNKISPKIEDNFAAGLAKDSMDCDLSGYLFIQFAKEVGLDLVGVHLSRLNSNRHGHFVVAYRENGKITQYIETTMLLYDKDFEGFGKGDAISAAQKYQEILLSPLIMSGLESKIASVQKMIQFMDSNKDAVGTIDPETDTVWGKREYLYLKENGQEKTRKFLQQVISACDSEIEKMQINYISYMGFVTSISSAKEWETANKGLWNPPEIVEAADL